jgi:starch phosphorylase
MPEEVDVELYFGPLRTADTLKRSDTAPMTVKEALGNGAFRYFCPLTCQTADRYGFTARVTPRGDDRLKFTPKLITWP